MILEVWVREKKKNPKCLNQNMWKQKFRKYNSIGKWEIKKQWSKWQKKKVNRGCKKQLTDS